MELRNAEITKDNRYEFEFEERFSEQNIKKTTKVSVDRVEPKITLYESMLVKTKKVQDYIVENVRDRCVYIADKEHRELFYKIAELIVKTQELPISVKNVAYPGSALILLEYGLLGVDDESVHRIELSIMDGLSEMTTTEDLIEEVEEETTESPLDELDENPFPFGGISGDFVDDEEEFNIGQIEEGEDNG